MKSLAIAAVLVLLTANFASAGENWQTLAEPRPDPPAWSLALLPEPEWSEKEAAETEKLLSRIQPNMIVAAKRFPWIEALAKQTPDCRLLAMDDPVPDAEAPPSPFLSVCDASSVHRISCNDNVPASLLRMKTSWTKRNLIGPRFGSAEQRALMIARTRQAFAEMSGSVVFLSDHPFGWFERGGRGWNWPRGNSAATTRITRPVFVDWSSLGVCLPMRSAGTARMPLVHLITGTGRTVSWDVLPADGSPAIWHAESLGLEVRHGEMVLTGPPPFDNPPAWIDDYISGNPALFPSSEWVRHANRPRKLPWKKHPGSPQPKGFPTLDLPQAHSIGMRDIDPAALPKDAVRSPSLRFAVLPDRYNEIGVPVTDGDDGLGVQLADLASRKQGRLYYCGMYGAWPVSATWFTDRYLLIAGTGPNEYTAGMIPMEVGQARDLLKGTEIVSLRLYDLLAGRFFTAVTLSPSGHIPMNFTEKIVFPGDEKNRAFLYSVWNGVEMTLKKSDQAPPLSPGKAAQLLGFDKVPLPKSIQWTHLGLWPSPDSWEPLPASFRPSTSSNHGDRFLRIDKLSPSYQNPNPGGTAVLRLIVQQSGTPSSYHGTGTPAAQAELMKLGGGLLPRWTSVHRCEGKLNRILLLGGWAPRPGPGGESSRWILMLDCLSHDGWRLDWDL
jgi:hypothetical protein